MSGACPIRKTDEAPEAARVSPHKNDAPWRRSRRLTMAVIMKWSKQSLALLVSSSLVLTSAHGWCADAADQSTAQPVWQGGPQPSQPPAEAAPEPSAKVG